MAKKLKSKTVGPKVDPYLDGLFTKLLERLTSLDRKMDSLISRSSVKHPQNGNNPSVPVSPAPVQPPARKERTLYEAICADCSKVCEVPFRPVEGRAVYCKECFGKRKNGGNRPGMPILTPAMASPKPVSKLGLAPATPAPAQEDSKKAKKSAPEKKANKKKKK